VFCCRTHFAYFFHVRSLISLFHIKKPINANLYYLHHFINTVSLWHTEQRVIHYTFLTKLHVTSGNSFCWPWCLNVCLVLSLRAETCRSDMVLKLMCALFGFLCDMLCSWLLVDGCLLSRCYMTCKFIVMCTVCSIVCILPFSFKATYAN
jgi:hypothetical protein